MISHKVQSRRDNLTCYYRFQERLDSALNTVDVTPSRFTQLADHVYDHNENEFVKHRLGRVELLNALLVVRRQAHLITDEMRELVEQHV